MATKKKTIGSPSTEGQEDPLQKYLAVVKEYQNVIFAVVVLTLAIGVLAVWKHEAMLRRESGAWLELEEAQKKTTPAEKVTPLVSKYEGTSAEPFFRLTLAAKLYEHGTKADLEQARDELKKVIAESSGNETLVSLAKAKLEGVEAELGDELTWKVLSSTAPVGSK